MVNVAEQHHQAATHCQAAACYDPGGRTHTFPYDHLSAGRKHERVIGDTTARYPSASWEPGRLDFHLPVAASAAHRSVQVLPRRRKGTIVLRPRLVIEKIMRNKYWAVLAGSRCLL